MRTVLAGDLGATNFRCAAVDETGRLRARRRRALPFPRTPRDVIELMTASFGESLEESPRRPACLSLSIKGRVDEARGLSLAMNDTPGWKNVPLGRLLGSRLGLPVLLESDARCMALGEAWKGRRAQDLVFINVGTGIGAGIIRDGRIYSGPRGHAGEYGHIVIDDSNKAFVCACGERGHWEAMAAGPSLALRARRARFGRNADGAAVARALKAGDKNARRIVEETGRCLGAGLYNVIRGEDPGLVVLGGGAAGDLLRPARAECRRRLSVFRIPCPPIVLSALGDDAGLLGAARRGLDCIQRV